MRIPALLTMIGLACTGSLEAQSKRKGKTAHEEMPPATAPATFAPVAENHALAGIWNDPEFTRRLIGSYGFHSELEPKLNAEEQLAYRDKIVPLLREDPKKAIGELQSLIKPGASAVFDFTLATIHFQNEEFPQAIELYEQALLKFPDYLRAQKNLAFALVRAGKNAEAIPHLARTITLGGQDGKIYGLLAFAYLNQEKYVSAQAAYQQAMLFEPENLEFKLGLVKCQISLHQYDAALAMLDELLQAHTEKPELWALQANVFVQTEQPLKAAVNLEILRKTDQASAQNLNLLGDIYLSRENTELALSAYQEAMEKESGQSAARALKAAEILVNRGAWDEARKLFATIREVAGSALETSEEMKLLKLQARVALAQGQAEESIKVVEGILARDPADGEALLLAGDFYARHSEPEKAEFRYEAAQKIDGFEAEALVKHAQLLVQAQKYDRAIELLRKAQKLRPRDNVQRYLEKLEQIALSARS